MSTLTTDALIGALALVLIAAGGWLIGAQIAARRRFARIMRENRALWYYTRVLIDWGYKPHTGAPPEPPDSIKHLYEFGDTE
mgnify:CR=1 FL=1